MTSSKSSLTLKLSPAHKSSISQSQAIDTKVTEFLKNSMQIPMDQSQKMSSSSLSNSQAFFESQINYLVKVVKQTNKLFQLKESEVKDLKQKLKEYESKIQKFQSTKFQQTMTSCKDEGLKRKKIDFQESERKSDDAKTRKKTKQNEGNINESLVRPINQQISSFQFTVSNRDCGKRLQNEMKMVQKQKQFLQSKIHSRGQQISKLRSQSQQLQKSLYIKQHETMKLNNENSQLQMEYKMLKSNYDLLEKQYNITEERYGKETGQYKIMIENLRQVLRNLQKTKSPKKVSKKEQEGYYSINKKMKQSGDSFSSQSDVSSLKSSKSGYLERNLKQENQLLRTELIKAFDEKGAIKSELKKYQKMLDKFVRQKNQLRKSQKLGEENDQNSLNKPILEIDDSFTSKIFKKNKASTILMVDNTEIKQKEIIQRHKISNLLNQLNKIINQLTENKSQENSQILEINQEVIESFIKKLQSFSSKKAELHVLMNKIMQQNQQLKKQKKQIQLKGKHDVAQLQSFLHEISQNKSQNKSIDSTDQAFKNIKIEKQINQQNKSFAKKERHYIEKINDQENQIIALKNKIHSLEEVSESFYKLTSGNPSSSNINLPAIQDQVILCSNQENQLKNTQNQVYTLSLFQSFKQKLTEFYELTIQELDNWEIQALNAYTSQNYVPQIKSAIFEPSYRIPQIVQRNILKISRQFKNIRGLEEENSPKSNQEKCENEFFLNQRMSSSFVSEDKKSQTLEEIMMKRVLNFNECSKDWIQKVIAKTPSEQGDASSSQKVQDETIKQKEVESLSSKRLNMAMTERPSVDRSKQFQIDMNEIDANSESFTSQELMRERQVFIRQEFSYFLQKDDPMNNLMKSANSKKSFHSIRF